MRFPSSFALSLFGHLALLAAILFWPAALMPRPEVRLDAEQPPLVGWLTLDEPGGRTGSKPGTVPPGQGGGKKTMPAEGAVIPIPEAPGGAPATPEPASPEPATPEPALPEPPAPVTPPAPEPASPEPPAPAVPEPATPEPPAPEPPVTPKPAPAPEPAPAAAPPAAAPAAAPADATPISAHKEKDAPAPKKTEEGKKADGKATEKGGKTGQKETPAKEGKAGGKPDGKGKGDALADALADARRTVSRRDSARNRSAVNDALRSMRTDAAVGDALREMGGEEGYGGGEGRGMGGGVGDGRGVQVSYQTMVSAIIRHYWTYPNQGDRSVPVAVAYVRLSSAGEVVDYRIEKSSGRSDFDASVLAAIRKANHHPLPAPPSGHEEEFTIRFYNAERQ